MRKTSLIFLGGIAGARLALLATQPSIIDSCAEAVLQDSYQPLNLFDASLDGRLHS